MPMVSNIVEIDGFKMLDGGISDSIPIHKFMEMGYEKNVVILTQHDGYRKKKNSMLLLIRLKLGKKYPNLVHDLEVRHIMYNKTLDDLKELERKGLVYIIRPENPVTIGRTERDPEKLQALYDIGRKEGLKHIRNVKNFLGE